MCSGPITLELFDAIRKTETGGESNPSNAIGDNGRSLGPYQIMKVIGGML